MNIKVMLCCDFENVCICVRYRFFIYFQILCEVLDILNQLVWLDSSQGSQILQVVKRIQTNVTEKFKSDCRDISIFVRVLRFLLNFGELYEMCLV
jgi:hypothetical protein